MWYPRADTTLEACVNLEGATVLRAPPERIWHTLLDVDQLAACLPGLSDVQQLDDRTFQGVVRASVGPIAGAFALTARITESDPPRALQVQAAGVDSVTSSTLTQTVALALEPAGADATTLSYRATVDIRGRLALLGDLVLRATAAAMLDEFVRRLRARVEDGPPSA